MKFIVSALLLLHGFIHLLGFGKAYVPDRFPQLSKGIPKQWGILWLLCSLLFLTATILFSLNFALWVVPTFIAIILSQVLIVRSWSDARYGTIVNALILIVALVYATVLFPSPYSEQYRNDIKDIITSSRAHDTLKQADIQYLPRPLQKYLTYVGAIGKPKVSSFTASFHGTMKLDTSAQWIPIRAHQLNTVSPVTRLFIIESSLSGIPLDGYHRYVHDSASMSITLARLFQLIDARGDTLTQSETVTLFNDMCLLAPATLIDPSIHWQEYDSTTVIATYRHGNYHVRATLLFDEIGALKNFISDDRYLSADGMTYKRVRWSTPIVSYRLLENRRIPERAYAVWHMPSHDFQYADFTLENIEYNPVKGP